VQTILGLSLVYTASHGSLGRSREIHFRLPESRSQNKSPCGRTRVGREVSGEIGRAVERRLFSAAFPKAPPK
jgi:hypothetical protein